MGKHKKVKTQKAKNGNKKQDDEDEDDTDAVNHDVVDPLSSFRNFLKKYENASLSEIYEKVKLLTLAHEMKRDEQIKLVIQGLMGLQNDCKSLIVKYKQIFAMYTSNDEAKIFL